MFTFKPLNNVYGILDITYWPYKMFGMAPYSRHRLRNGEFAYQCRRKIKYIFPVFFIVLLIYVMISSILKELNTNNDAYEVFIQLCLYIYHILAATVTLWTFTSRTDYFLNSYKLCFEVDKAMKSIKLKTYYKIQHKLSLFGVAILPLWIIIQAMPSITQRKSFMYCLRNIYLYGMPSALAIISANQFILLGTLIYNRFHILNTYLEEDIQQLESYKQIQYRVMCIAQIHAKLCVALKQLLYSLGFSIIMLYSFMYIQVSAIVLFFLERASSKIDIFMYFWTMFYILLSSLVLVLATVLKYESSRTAYITCELTASFFDDDLGTRRNTFLLQLLHQNVDVKICGSFELHLNRVLEDVQVISSMILFISQLRA